MDRLTPNEQRLVKEIQGGLPIVPEPYAAIGERLGIPEEGVLDILGNWSKNGILKRFGFVLKHRKLGIVHNAMVVWNIPDEEVDQIGAKMLRFPFVRLCYRRKRSLPEWPYNIYCMILGTDRKVVQEQIDQMTNELALGKYQQTVLFSKTCYKQRGAHYAKKHKVD